MANPFSNISSKIEQHPVISSVIVGGVGLVVTIYFIKKNQSSQSSSTSATQPNLCTDSNGDVIDCTTGQPVGTSGGFSLQPTNDNSDVLTAIGNLSQAIQNLIQNGSTSNNGTNPPTTTPPVNNPPPPVIPPRPVIPPAPQIPPKNPPGIIAPGPSGGVHPTVTVAQWSSTNTPWNSTLWGIAHHFGESLATVERLNPQIKNPNLIKAGQKVYY